MSECAGRHCTHPECSTAGDGHNLPHTLDQRTLEQAAEAGYTPRKWASMNRAQRRAATRAARRSR